MRVDEQTPASAWSRHPCALLGHHWFHFLVAAIVVSVGTTLWLVIPGAAAPLVAVGMAVAATLAALAYGYLINSRLRLDEVVTRWSIVGVFVVGGVAGQLIVLLEYLLPKRPMSLLLVGPIEETAKLAVPVLLYFLLPRRFRDPRAGLAAVLASAAAFAVAEVVTVVDRAFTHVLSFPVNAAQHLGLEQVGWVSAGKPLTDPLMQMALTGIFAAVAWRSWQEAGGFALTGKVVAALVGVMALHSAIDTILTLALPTYVKLVGLLFPIGVYFIFRAAARADVPPDMIPHVPPGWRPRTAAIGEGPAARPVLHTRSS